MPQKSRIETAKVCNSRRLAMRLDEREFCDAGGTRALLASALCVSESTLTKWLALNGPHHMPEGHDNRWMGVTRSPRLLTAGYEIDNEFDQLMGDLLARLVEQGVLLEAA